MRLKPTISILQLFTGAENCIMQHFIWVFTVCQNTHLGVSGPQKVKDHLLPALFSPSAIGLQRTDGKLRFCISLIFRRFLYALYCCPVIFKIIIISNDSRKDAVTRDLTNKRRA